METIRLKKDKEIEVIKAINELLNKKVPYVHRNYTKTTRVRIVVRQKPIKLARYFRGKSSKFKPFFNRAQPDDSILSLGFPFL